MVRVMPTETEETKAQTASSIIAPQQETIVLTACMRSKDVREDVLPMLLEDDFVKSDHRALFRAIRAMHEANYPIDDVSLLDYLRSNRELDTAGGEQAESHPGLPRLSDLRESGSIEQDADTVLFLSRDPDEIQDEKSGSRQVVLSVAKNRSGPTGGIDMLFVPTSTKFYEVGPRKETSDE